MMNLWIASGVIAGWIFIEIVACATRTRWPWLLNTGMAFVGGVTAYTIANYLTN